MFLPNEGLYAEVLRRPGLADCLQRDHRIVSRGRRRCGDANSFQMGFRTLAIERRSSEVWALLGAVKTEFAQVCHGARRDSEEYHRAASKIDESAQEAPGRSSGNCLTSRNSPRLKPLPLLEQLVINVEEGELLPG